MLLSVFSRGPVVLRAVFLFALLLWRQDVAADSGVSPLSLEQADSRYALVSLAHSSGFLPAPPGIDLAQADDALIRDLADEHPRSLRPDFRQHDRYWLQAHIINRTDNADWMFHISNFGFQEPTIRVRNTHGQTLKTLTNDGFASGTDINTLGRATSIRLQPGERYELMVEVRSSLNTWHPYMGLMSARQYDRWATAMSFASSLAIGIIVGLILVGLICWAITREATFIWGALSALLMLIYYFEHSSLPALLWQWDYQRGFLFWVLFTLAQLGQLAFAASFLRLNRQSGRWFWAFTGTGILLSVSCLLAAWLPFDISIRLFGINYLLVSLVILGSGIAKVRREGSYYIIYLLGWFPMVLSLLQVVLIINGPEQKMQVVGESYKMIHALYIQVGHLLLHVTALILRIRALRKEKLEAEFLSTAKSRFIAQSSHDLSQPLSSMGVFLGHMGAHIQGTEGKKIFFRLKKAHRQMSESFSSIMDLGKLESGGMVAVPREVAVADIFARLEHEFRMLAQEKGIALAFQPCSLTVFSDPELLERVLRNLLANAIKYTDSGKVIVGCRRRQDHVEIQVLDTGCGIDVQSLEHIFDIYHRAGLTARHKAGTGIGLSIVRHICELLDHPVSVSSMPGRGSTFTVTVPRKGHLPDAPARPVSPAEPAVVALVIQDSALRDTLAAHFAKWSCEVRVFDSLEAASRSTPLMAVLLGDPESLSQTGLPADEIGRLTAQCISACVGGSADSLTDSWIALAPNPGAAQLRALLNTALRRRADTLPPFLPA